MGEKLSVNPWLGMWTRPRDTIRAIIQYNPRYLLPLLCWIYGFSLLLQLAQNFSLGEKFSTGGIIIGALLGAFFVGILGINIGSALLYWTGKWIGGIGTFENVRAAVAWSNVTNLINILIWMINVASFGTRLFTRSFVETPFAGGELVLIFFASLIQAVVALWTLIIFLKSLGEAQGFSAWRALLNVVIPVALGVICSTVLVWLFSLMVG